jgi:hypothetical protein
MGLGACNLKLKIKPTRLGSLLSMSGQQRPQWVYDPFVTILVKQSLLGIGDFLTPDNYRDIDVKDWLTYTKKLQCQARSAMQRDLGHIIYVTGSHRNRYIALIGSPTPRKNPKPSCLSQYPSVFWLWFSGDYGAFSFKQCWTMFQVHRLHRSGQVSNQVRIVMHLLINPRIYTRNAESPSMGFSSETRGNLSVFRSMSFHLLFYLTLLT